ncbi:MAG: OBAP family protein [Holophaga sp.]|nr:OBAP family protein [Holophaga sp.]
MNQTCFPILLSMLLWTTLPGQSSRPPQDHGPCAQPGRPPEPLRSIHTYLCGFHFYNGDPSRQVVAHHYCAPVGPEVMQCVIYDANRKGARLVGVEYIVSAKLFKSFPEEEKKLWHSHRFEVKSGQLVAPALGAAAEKSLMKDLVLTYGKIWQTWQVDRNSQVPMGIPQLLMGFTADGQVEPGLVARRDRELGIATAARKAQRADLPVEVADPGADAWQSGVAAQLELGAVRRAVPAAAR